MEEKLFEKSPDMEERIKYLAEKEEQTLIRIRRELHKVPETGVYLPKTYEIIRRELQKIPGVEVIEHAAEGYGLIGIMRGKLPDGKTVLLRADIDALPVEEPEGLPYRSEHPGCMHACGHDGHAAWLIGAARILSDIRDNWGGCVKFVFQPGEEVGKGATALIEKDQVLENPKVDMAFAAHGWPSVESGKIGIARRYAFGCVGGFSIKIMGKKGHASWPEETIDPIAAAIEIYQHMPSVLTKKISGTEAKVFSVTYMQAGDVKIHNVIPETCEFGGTMRAANMDVLKRMGKELEKEVRAVCHVAGAEYKADIRIHGGAVHNAVDLLEGTEKTAKGILGEDKVYFIEHDHLGGENFSEFSSRVQAVYLFIGIRPKEKEQIPGLHSAEYRFDDHVLKGAAGVFAALGYYGCMRIIQKQEKGTGTEEWKK